jgi:hypothetical protein
MTAHPSIAAVVAVALVSIAAIGDAEAAEPAFARFPAKESGMLAGGGGDSTVQWIDNERIIFIGARPGETRVEDGVERPKNDLHIWNTTSGAISREAEFSLHSHLCVAPDYFRADYRRGGVSYVRAGKPGLTMEARLDVDAYKAGVLAVSPVSCREYNPKQLAKRHDGWALPLLGPGEVIDRASPDAASVLRYFPSQHSRPVELSRIPNHDVDPFSKFSYHLNKYVLGEIRGNLSAQATERVWLLDRKGAVEEVVIPAGPWMAASIKNHPTRAGWVVSSRARGFARDMGAAGIYLIRDGTASRFVTAYPYALAVSPDGCKLAAAIELKREEKARPMLWLVDLCARSGADQGCAEATA